MQITETYWSNLRNLKPRRLSWCSGLNLLIGNNGAGKTNMLEALNIACGWGAFYNANVRDLRAWQDEGAGNKAGNVEIYCEASGEENIRSEISVSTRISARMNKERVSFSELRTHIPALYFLPGDMNLIDGTPGMRRVFIDKLCSIISVPYARRLSDYKRLVRHRIKLLRIGKSPDITSPLMSSLGSWIWSIRKSVVEMLNVNISNENSSELSPFIPRIELKLGGMAEYSGNWLYDPRAIQSEFLKRLEYYSEREIKSKTPLMGPHRDDLLISINRCNNENSGALSSAGVLSRGQKRRVVVSLMLASGRVMEQKLKRKPIFLLDEIFSELDEEARQTVADALYNTKWQIYAAGAENNISNWRGEVYCVNDGEIL